MMPFPGPSRALFVRPALTASIIRYPVGVRSHWGVGGHGLIASNPLRDLDGPAVDLRVEPGVSNRPARAGTGVDMRRLTHRVALVPLLVVGGSALGGGSGDVDEVGIVRGALWFLDATGSNRPDGGDAFFNFGLPTDKRVWGDWNGDGHDEAGIFRNGTWFLDTNGNFAADGGDTVFTFGLATDVPLVFRCGNNDVVGIFRGGLWFTDLNGNHAADVADLWFHYGMAGDVPVLGDWFDLDCDQPGVFRAGLWFLDTNATYAADTFFYFGTAGDTPVAGA